MRIQVVGHSHIHALRAALKSTSFPHPIDVLHLLKEVPGRQYCVVENGRMQLDAGLRDKLQAPGEGGQVLVSQVGGSTHWYLGLFRHPEPFDFFDPARADRAPSPDARVLTRAFVGAVLADMLRTEFDVLAALRNATPRPVYHLESPPPVFDREYCKANLPQALLDQFHTREITDAPFRSKIWRLHGDLVEAECLRLGIGFVPCPAAAVDAGFLRPQYWADPLHGNADYGRLVLEQIATLAAA